MVAYDREPTPWAQHLDCLLQPLFQVPQLPIHIHTQRLKCAGGRVDPAPAAPSCLHRHHSRQLGGGVYRPVANDRAGYPPRRPLLAELEYDVRERGLGVGVHHLVGRLLHAGAETHIQPRLPQKAEPPARGLHLPRREAQIEENSVRAQEPMLPRHRRDIREIGLRQHRPGAERGQLAARRLDRLGVQVQAQNARARLGGGKYGSRVAAFTNVAVDVPAIGPHPQGVHDLPLHYRRMKSLPCHTAGRSRLADPARTGAALPHEGGQRAVSIQSW